MIINVRIGLGPAGMTALVGSRVYNVQASNALKDILNRAKTSPITVDGELIEAPDGVSAGTLLVSRIVQAQVPPLPVPVVEAARPSPAFRAAVEQGPVRSPRAPTVREKAVAQLAVPRPDIAFSIQRRREPPREGPLSPRESAALLSHLRGVVGR